MRWGRNGLARLRGPRTDKLCQRQIFLSGSKVVFEVPPNNHPRHPFRPLPSSFNIYDPDEYWADGSTVAPLYSIALYKDDWCFKGWPILEGEVGWVEMGVFLLHTKEFGSVFDPLRMQKAIERFIYMDDGPGAGRFHTVARCDWSVRGINGTEWVHYDNQIHDHQRALWHTPLSDEHILTVSMKYYTYRESEKLGRELARFGQEVVDTFVVDLSDDARESKDGAARRHPERKFPSSLGQLRWQEKPVEDEFTILTRLLKERRPDNQYYEKPDGSIDHERENQEYRLLEKEIREIVKEQEKTLQKTMERTLANHLEFDD
jgi:hypothetical protein